MMKNTFLLFLFVCFAFAVQAQVDATIDKGSGWLYFSGIPGTTPSVSSGSEAAINLNTREAYIWNRDSSEWQPWLLIDSLAYASDTLRIWQNGSATPLYAVIPSGTIDTAYLSGDTLNIVFAGDTTEVVLAGPGDGNGIYSGSGTVPASTWVEQLGSLIFDIDSLGSFTVGDIDEKNTGAIISVSNTGGNDGQITLRSGSGGGYTDATVQVNNTAGTLPIWTRAYTLGNSSLTEGSGVLSSSLTGALKLPAGTDAQDPVWSAGMLRYNTY
jgi:hypothetical protein